MRYGSISKDETLQLEKTTEIYLKPVERKTAEVELQVKAEADSKLKPVRFAELPKFNQETQAVYQDAPVDKDDYIKCGVKVVDLPEEKEPIEEPILTK